MVDCAITLDTMKQKQLLIIIGAIVLIAGLAAGAYFFLNREDTEPKTETTDDETGEEPTETTYYESGQIWFEAWSIDNQQHRENDLPAWILYYESGQIQQEAWLLSGQPHRENDLPAFIEYDKNGEIDFKEWYLNGELIKTEPTDS